MSETVLLENEFGVVRYNSEHEYIYHTFHKPIGGEPFRTILDTGVEHLAKNKAHKWLSDDRNNAEFAPEDAQFAIADWGPRAAAAGWKYWALIVPESMAGRASMQDIVAAFFQLGVEVRVFIDIDTAKEWLISK